MGLTQLFHLKKNRKLPWPYEKQLYKHRNIIKRYFLKLKRFRKVFTRYDKLDFIFTSTIALAFIFALLFMWTLLNLCEIDNGFQCDVASIELLSKIKVPKSNFKYELNSVKDGKSILNTMDIFKPDISKILEQTQNNTEEKTSWLEEKKLKHLNRNLHTQKITILRK